LIFQLKRAQFNKINHTAFKVNDIFKFNEEIFMDRYLSINSQSSKRLQAVKWEKDRRSLKTKLQSYLNYNNLGLSLPKIIDGTLDYISSKAAQKIDTENEKIIKNHLQNISEEVDSEIKVIESSINDLQGKIDSIYNDMGMDHTYVLHSILVHDGFVGAGHYWTFTKDHRNGNWVKANDACVEEVDKSYVFKESEGGNMNMSAYCLFYVSELSLAQSISQKEEELDLIPSFLKVS